MFISMDNAIPIANASVLITFVYRFPLEVFGNAVKIKWQVKIPDTEVLKNAGMQSMHTVLKLTQLD